jgi:DNA-directed RNA polymerase specialized sigma24 family protein
MTNEELQTHFLSHRSKLVAYVAKRVQDHDLAEDIVQEGLLKAMKTAPDLREDEKIPVSKERSHGQAGRGICLGSGHRNER